MSPVSPITHLRTLISLLGVLILGAIGASPALAATTLTITPVTWDVVLLDSNNVSSGPNQFPIVMRVCNTGSESANAVAAAFTWNTANSYIAIAGSATESIGGIAAGACRYATFVVEVTRNVAAFDAARGYTVTVTSSNAATVTSPANRQIIVKSATSQASNKVVGIRGDGGCLDSDWLKNVSSIPTGCVAAPTTVALGKEYTYRMYGTLTSSSQVASFVAFPPDQFEIISATSKFQSPTNATANGPYADACGWNPTSTSGTYLTCVGPVQFTGGTAGGNFIITYRVKVIGTGTASLTAANWFYTSGGGGSYKYNGDYGPAIATVNTQVGLTTTVNGPGTVTSSSGGINCTSGGGTCEAFYSNSPSVTLTATPDAGQQFAGWSGACAGSSLTCTVAMSQTRDVIANFGAYNTLTTAVTGNGYITSSPSGIDCADPNNGTGRDACAASFSSGTSVTLTRTVDTGESFLGWSGACSGTAATCTVTVDQARFVGATFSPYRPLDVTVSGNGAVTSSVGDINCTATNGGTSGCTARILEGTSVTLTATANGTSTFSGWTGGSCAGTSTTCTVTMSQARAVTATFTAPLSVSVLGTGGVTSDVGGIQCGSAYPSPTCDAGYAAGTSVTLTQAPSGGSVFLGWLGCDLTTATTCTVAMDEAVSVQASFGWTLTAEVPGGGGHIDADVGTISGCTLGSGVCTGDYAEGATVTLTANPNSGMQFDGWTGACAAEASNQCTVTMTQAQTVGAAFSISLVNWTLAVTVEGDGAVSASSGAIVDCTSAGVNCSDMYADGLLVTLTATPGTGQRVEGWSDATCAGETCTVTMDQAQSITVTFAPQMHTVTVGVVGPGAIEDGSDGCVPGTSPCTWTYAYGSQVTFTPTPDANAQFDGFTDPHCTGTAPCTLTITEDLVLAAEFSMIRHALDVTVTGPGAISADAGSISDCREESGICSGDYDRGTTVTLTATANANKQFTGWGGACAGTATTCAVSMDQARSVTATFAPIKHQVAVVVDGPGAVSANGGSITDCRGNSGSCSGDYDQGSSVTLTATPDPGDIFVGWSGGPGPSATDGGDVSATAAPTCSGTGDCTINVNQATSVTATFVSTYALDVTVTGTGSVAADSGAIAGCTASSGTCSDTYQDGTIVTLTATAGSGQSFDGWGGACAGTGTCTVTMSEARSVTATFSPITHSLTVTVSGDGSVAADSGSITACTAGSSPCTDTINDGVTVTLTATASPGAVFDGWGGACAGTGSCTVTMDQARSVTATFSPVPPGEYALGVSVSGSGSVTADSGAIADCREASGVCTDTYTDGTTVTLTATPDTGWSLAGWGGACALSPGSTCTVTMSEAQTVTAHFQRNTYTLTVLATGPGSITDGTTTCPSNIPCMLMYEYGTEVTLTATPGTDAQLDAWSGAGCSGDGATCVVTVSGNDSVDATFSTITREVTVTVTGAGSVSADSGAISGCAEGTGICTGTYDQGSTVTFTATPDAGYEFSGWGGDCAGQTGPTCTLTITAATSVTAGFTRQAYELSVDIAGTGSGGVTSSPVGIDCVRIAAPCTHVYDGGEQVTLTAHPGATTTFGGWSGDCSDLIPTCVVTMDQARSVTATFDAQTTYDLDVSVIGTGGSVAASGTSISNCTAGTQEPWMDCLATLMDGTETTLAATAQPGYEFVGWGGACSGTQTTCDLTMSENRTVTATFAPVDVTWPLTVTVQGNGTVSADSGVIADCTASSGTCTDDYADGQTVTLTATPGPGQVFAGWSGDGCAGTSPVCTVAIDQARAISATFTAPSTHVVTVTPQVGATITATPGPIAGCATDNGQSTGVCSGAYPSGGNVTLQVTLAPGYRLAGWSGACAGQGETCTVSVTDALATAPIVERIDPAPQPTTATLTLSTAGPGALVLPSGEECTGTCQVRLATGSTITLTPRPSANAALAAWDGACAGQPAASCTLVLNADTTARAVFAAQGAPTVVVTPPRQPVRGGQSSALVLAVASAPEGGAPAGEARIPVPRGTVITSLPPGARVVRGVVIIPLPALAANQRLTLRVGFRAANPATPTRVRVRVTVRQGTQVTRTSAIVRVTPKPQRHRPVTG